MLRRPSAGSERTSEIRGFDIEGDLTSDSPLKMKPLSKSGTPPFRPTADAPSVSGTPEGVLHYTTTATLSSSPVSLGSSPPPYNNSSNNGNGFNGTNYHVTPTKGDSNRLDDSALEYAWDSPSEYQSPPAKNNDRMTSEKDTARMLRGLGSASSSAEKAMAARELRHLVRTADEIYWTEHCPQVLPAYTACTSRTLCVCRHAWQTLSILCNLIYLFILLHLILLRSSLPLFL